MPRPWLLAVPLLASCATAAPPARSAPGAECRSDDLGRFAGREATDVVRDEILRASGARVLRWVQPGMMVTMEFRADRVTAWLAAGNRIERVNCG
jgi:hypothetical protein